MKKENKNENNEIDIRTYRSVYIPLQIFEQLEHLSLITKSKKCETLKKALGYYEEILNEKRPETRVLKDLFIQYTKAFKRLMEKIDGFESKQDALYSLYIDMLNRKYEK